MRFEDYCVFIEVIKAIPEKCGQNVVKFGESKKKDLVKRLNFSNLQGLFVPRAGLLIHLRMWLIIK